MKKHVKIYLGYTQLDESEVMCEICRRKAVDIHHLESRRMGGSKNKDFIENLIALCRQDHLKCHASVSFNDYAKTCHIQFLDEL